MTSLSFSGEWTPSTSIAIALGLASIAWWFYPREMRAQGSRLGSTLPWLRATAIFLITLMLAGPVLRHRFKKGTPTRLICWVDTSQSMGLCDPEMDPSRKLALAEQLGWIRPGAVHLDVSKACETLREYAASLALLNTDAPDERIWAPLEKKANDSLTLLRKSGTPSAVSDKMEREVCLPWKEFSRRLAQSPQDPHSIRAALRQITEAAQRWLQELDIQARSEAEGLIKKDASLQRALQRFDQTPRMQRLASLLLEDPRDSFLAQLASKFDVELWAMDEKSGRLLWNSSDSASPIPTIAPAANTPKTDLAQILNANGNAASTQPASSTPPANTSAPPGDQVRSAIILFSDGQHNEGISPIQVATLLGDRRIPVFPVGFGQTNPASDIAVTGVDAPNDVFYDDRLHGTLHLRESVPLGQQIELKIRHGEKVVWEKKVTASGQPSRSIAFDFPIRDLMPTPNSKKTTPTTTIHSVVPLNFIASALPFQGEREIRNNSANFHVRATQRRRKMLILDGRPRWETRYLRNLFERDPQWEVTSLLGGLQPETFWPRGEGAGHFPSTEQQLHTYDLIVFGEVPRELLKEDELRWISSFVGEHGGGLLLLDGARSLLKPYVESQSPITSLFPVRFTDKPALASLPEKLLPSAQAESLTPFRFSGSAAGVDPVWQTLPPPRSLVSCIALPGTETVLEAWSGKTSTPAMVTRLFGSGRVVYSAFDETWRWRLEVAGLHQERFWNQLIPWIAEPPYTVQNERIALDAGRYLYNLGDSAKIRARIRDAKGMPLVAKTIRGKLSRDGAAPSTVVLEADPSIPGVFQFKTPPLETGLYEFFIEPTDPVEKQNRVSVSFEVQPRQTAELSELTLNEPLMTKIAESSKGEFLREDQMPRLLDILQPWTEGQIQEKETILWQSYPWFFAVISLLTLEWAFRKRLGLV